MQDDEWLTLRQAAERSGKSYTTLYAQVRLGNLPGESRDDPARRKSGGGPIILVRRADLDAYLARQADRQTRAPLTNAERQRRKYARKKANLPSATP